jgi:hypothetical protein
MTRPTTRLLAGAVAVAAVAAPAAANARRAPTFDERVAITRALQFAVAVSANGRFATATPEVLIPHPVPAKDPCLRYAGNGFFVLRKAGRWKVIFVGSDWPPCSLGVPRDLTACAEG